MNKLKTGVLLASVCFSFSVLGSSGHSNTVDNDGCWDGSQHFRDGGDRCMQVSSSNWLSNDRLKVVYKNSCGNRIYAKFCNAKNNGTSDCGASGIMPYGTKSWTTYNATGSYSWMAVGSDRGSKDWVCARRVAGDAWYDLK